MPDCNRRGSKDEIESNIEKKKKIVQSFEAWL